MDVHVCGYEVCGCGYDKCVIEVRVCVDVCGYGRYSISMGVTLVQRYSMAAIILGKCAMAVQHTRQGTKGA